MEGQGDLVSRVITPIAHIVTRGASVAPNPQNQTLSLSYDYIIVAMEAKSSIHDEQPRSSEEDPKSLPPVPGAVPQSCILRSSYVKLHEAFATHLSETPECYTTDIFCCTLGPGQNRVWDKNPGPVVSTDATASLKRPKTRTGKEPRARTPNPEPNRTEEDPDPNRTEEHPQTPTLDRRWRGGSPQRRNCLSAN